MIKNSSTQQKGLTTYLLGAGASANSLPIVINYAKRFTEFVSFLNSFANHKDFQKKQNEISKICQDFEWLIKKIELISTDSFACELNEKNQALELNKLKKLLTIFFIIEQIRNPVDKRYYAFLNKIWTGKGSELPSDKFRILNWNYDFQIEMALTRLAEYKNIFDSTVLQRQCLPSTLPLYEDSIERNYYKNFAIDKFSLCHLNGVCFCYKYDDRVVHNTQAGPRSLPFSQIFDPFEKNRKPIKETLESQFFNYLNLLTREGHMTALEFAFEEPEDDRSPYNIKNEVFMKAIEATKESEILVVIGYSFPDYNFKFDKQIISAMTNIKKIFFQDPNSTKIEKRFALLFPEIKDAKFISIKDVDDFVVPEI